MWAFATATADGGPTRISLLLDTIADTVAGAPARHHRPLYHTFETLRPRIEEAPQDLWNEVVDLHSLVLGWYDDRNLFHKIGYLVAAGGASFRELVGLAQGSTKTEFHGALDGRIRDSLSLSRSGVESLTYQTSTRTARALLLMNVETVRGRRQSSLRLLLRRPGPAAVVLRAHPRPELARSQHRRAVDRVAERAPKGARRPEPSRTESSRR